MERPRYRMVASVGPSPFELKKPVDKSYPREIISYNGNVFAIRFSELRNLGLDYHDEIVLMCQERGLEDPVFFGKACMYCGNATTNLDDLVEMSDGNHFILNDMPKVNCTYRSEKDIKVASTFSSGDGKQKPFYAIRERCAFEDSLISYLADNGLLKKYEVDIDFNFKPITDFELGDEIPDEYLVKNVNKRLPAEPRITWRLLRFLRSFL